MNPAVARGLQRFGYLLHRLAVRLDNYALRLDREGWQGSFTIRDPEDFDFIVQLMGDDEIKPGDYCELVFE